MKSARCHRKSASPPHRWWAGSSRGSAWCGPPDTAHAIRPRSETDFRSSAGRCGRNREPNRSPAARYALRSRRPAWPRHRSAASRSWTSLLGNVDRDFGAVGLRKPRLVLEALGHRAVDDLVRVSVFVEFEKLGRQGFAAGVALTLLLIDPYLECSRHSAFPCDAAHMVAHCGDYNGADMMRQPEFPPPSRRRSAALQDE